MRYYALLAMLMSSLIAKAQKTATEFVDKSGEACNENEAVLIRTYTRDDSGATVTDKTKKGVTVMQGHIRSFRERTDSSEWNGWFTYYNGDGTRLMDGMYRNRRRDGLWHYYTRDGSVARECILSAGKLTYDKFYDKGSSRISSEHKYSPVGDTSVELLYHPGGNVKRRKATINGKVTELSCYTIDGADTACGHYDSVQIYTFVEQMPIPMFNMMEYLSQNLVYPDSAKAHNKQGRVMVQFVVNEDGTVSEVTVLRGVCAEIDAEAVRVMRAMPLWKPGRQKGQPVRVTYTQPITFKLEDK